LKFRSAQPASDSQHSLNTFAREGLQIQPLRALNLWTPAIKAGATQLTPGQQSFTKMFALLAS